MATKTPATDDAAQNEIENVDAARTTAEGIEAEGGKGMKAYVSDRNLAEVNANQVFYMDPRSDLGKRLLATGYVTETDDPQA